MTHNHPLLQDLQVGYTEVTKFILYENYLHNENLAHSRSFTLSNKYIANKVQHSKFKSWDKRLNVL